MVRVPTHRALTHPGEMLLEEFLNPMDLTQRDLAEAIHVPYQRVNELINGRRGITPSTALSRHLLGPQHRVIPFASLGPSDDMVAADGVGRSVATLEDRERHLLDDQASTKLPDDGLVVARGSIDPHNLHYNTRDGDIVSIG